MHSASRRVVSAHHRYGLRFEQMEQIRLPFLPEAMQGPDAGDLLRNWHILAADPSGGGRLRFPARRQWHAAARDELQAVFEWALRP